MKISFKSEAALPYIEKAAESLREKGLALIHELPEEMIKSGAAVNESIKDVFEECDFTFAFFIEKDDRPGRKFLGLSALTSLVCMDSSMYYMNSTNEGLISFVEKELPVSQLASDMKEMMESIYNHAKE